MDYVIEGEIELILSVEFGNFNYIKIFSVYDFLIELLLNDI